MSMNNYYEINIQQSNVLLRAVFIDGGVFLGGFHVIVMVINDGNLKITLTLSCKVFGNRKL